MRLGGLYATCEFCCDGFAYGLVGRRDHAHETVQLPVRPVGREILGFGFHVHFSGRVLEMEGGDVLDTNEKEKKG